MTTQLPHCPLKSQKTIFAMPYRSSLQGGGALDPDSRKQSSTACLEWSSRASSVWIWWGPAVQAGVPAEEHQFLPVICTSSTHLTCYTWNTWEQPPALLPKQFLWRQRLGTVVGTCQKLFQKTSMGRNAWSVTPRVLPNLLRTSQQVQWIYPHGI